MTLKALPSELYSVDQTRELDTLAAKQGVSGAVLMERAGRAALEVMMARWPEVARPVVVCGGGNNGGDGYVLARLALETGLSPVIYQMREPDQLRGDARLMAERARDAGVPMRTLTTTSLPRYEDHDLVVDALLGTGLSGCLRGDMAELIEGINNVLLPIFALDVPSGLIADSGSSAGAVMEAQATLAFIGVNRGLLTAEGPLHTGELLFDDLNLDARLYEEINQPVHRPGDRWLNGWLHPRARDAHKGRLGHVVVVGGDHGFGGAAIMTAQAAARCGAGRVSLATRAEHVPVMLARQPEVMARAVETPDDLDPLLETASVVAIGPGLGTDSWGQALLERALNSEAFMVADADALNLLARIKPEPRNYWMMTPHPGEAGRLLGCDAASIQYDRFGAVDTLVQAYGGIVLLKGLGTLVGNRMGERALISDGNPGMASAGMGDVLTGVIAALRAQGMMPFQAAALGAVVHARAADRVAARDGERGLLATDLLADIRRQLDRRLR